MWACALRLPVCLDRKADKGQPILKEKFWFNTTWVDHRGFQHTARLAKQNNRVKQLV